ncbi:MAG: hypothetical protein PUK70_07415 [Bacteroidales bacterium]|nr:hypothetical protein [Bacteroidales bacterium]MDY6002215.1 hypothetical protein [Candidatus Cryptobacteroides sp.]
MFRKPLLQHDLGIGWMKIGSMSLSDPMTKNVSVDNCIIKNGCHDVECGEGVIIFHSSDNAVTHNEICNFYYTWGLRWLGVGICS